MRAFVALPLPDATLREAAALIERLRKGLAFGGPPIGWTSPDTLHLTLKFLGSDVGERPEDIEAIAAALRPVCAAAPPVEVAWGLVTALPELREPRVLVVEPTREARRDLARLAAAVERALLPLGFEPERRAFRPHLTLGRVKSPKGSKVVVDTLRANGRFAPAPAQLGHVVLFRSDLGRGGARHTPLADLPLGGAPHVHDRDRLAAAAAAAAGEDAPLRVPTPAPGPPPAPEPEA